MLALPFEFKKGKETLEISKLSLPRIPVSWNWFYSFSHFH